VSADRWLGQVHTGRLHLIAEDSVLDEREGYDGQLIAVSRCNSDFLLREDAPRPMWHVLCTRCLRLLAHDLGVLR
jgi:hypothetical protein